MFDIGIGEVFVLLVVALLVFGPDKLPEMAKQAASFVRDLRTMVSNARSDLSGSVGDLGIDKDDLKTLSDLRNPKSFVRSKVLDGVDLGLDDLGLDDEPANGTRRNGTARNGNGTSTSSRSSSARAASTSQDQSPSDPAPAETGNTEDAAAGDSAEASAPETSTPPRHSTTAPLPGLRSSRARPPTPTRASPPTPTPVPATVFRPVPAAPTRRRASTLTPPDPRCHSAYDAPWSAPSGGRERGAPLPHDHQRWGL